MPTYTTSGKDILLDGKVVGTAPDPEEAKRMAERSQAKAGGGTVSASKVGEATIIDPTTFEIKGKDSGKVYDKGVNVQEALAKQQAITGGVAPNVGGRPDLLATAPTAKQTVEPYIDPQTGQTITPTVATPAQLAQNAAGTLPSFDELRGITKPIQKFENYTDLIKAATSSGASQVKSDLLGAPDDYDNQILRQKSALFTKLYGKDLTPDELKWLTPAQSQAILSNDNKLIEAQIAGLNTITQGRKEMRKEAEDKALKQYELFSKSGTSPDQLPTGFLNLLDDQMGLPTGTFSAIYRSDFAKGEREKQIASLEAAKSINEYLDTIPLGESVTIGGNTYIGTDTGKIEINQQTGDVYAMREDSDSLSGFTVTKVGNVGSQVGRELQNVYNRQTGNYELWSVNPNDASDAKPVTQGGFGGASSQGVNSYALMEDYPQDEGFSETSWCVEWSRKIAVDGSLPAPHELDSIDQKAAWVDKSLSYSNITAGNWILTNEDSQNGHMALITDIQTNPAGQKVAILAESNYKAGKVTYGRTMILDEKNMATNGGKIMGFHKAQLKSQYTSQPEALITEPLTGTLEVSTTSGIGLTGQGNATEKQAAGFALRIENDLNIFDSLSNYVSNLNATELFAQKKLPNWMRNENYQLLDQAQRDFVNAVLRRESGAAIVTSEFENAEKQYFPQPGDSTSVLEQKKKNRKLALQGIAGQAGTAYVSGYNENAGQNTGQIQIDSNDPLGLFN